MIYQIKIQLQGVTKPPIWRRILIDSTASFDTLHTAIQKSMGWDSTHLFSFGYTVGYNDLNITDLFMLEDGGEGMDACDIAICDHLNDAHPKMKYTYDFGDRWYHDIVLEKTMEGTTDKITCIGGKGSCPPDDFGGIGNFMYYRDKLQGKDLSEIDPDNPYQVWMLNTAPVINNTLDFKYFDIDEANERLSKIEYEPVLTYEDKMQIVREKLPEIAKQIEQYFTDPADADIKEKIIENLPMLIAPDFPLFYEEFNTWAPAIILLHIPEERHTPQLKETLSQHFGINVPTINTNYINLYNIFWQEIDNWIKAMGPDFFNRFPLIKKS